MNILHFTTQLTPFRDVLWCSAQTTLSLPLSFGGAAVSRSQWFQRPRFTTDPARSEALHCSPPNGQRLQSVIHHQTSGTSVRDSSPWHHRRTPSSRNKFEKRLFSCHSHFLFKPYRKYMVKIVISCVSSQPLYSPCLSSVWSFIVKYLLDSETVYYIFVPGFLINLWIYPLALSSS